MIAVYMHISCSFANLIDIIQILVFTNTLLLQILQIYYKLFIFTRFFLYIFFRLVISYIIDGLKSNSIL
ncbi:hypothetical protein AN1V17_34350 [Vallitalea sediminicola]